jgi:hypothetical protein
MKTMNMPGFMAEVSLAKSRDFYLIESYPSIESCKLTPESIFPAMMKEEIIVVHGTAPDNGGFPIGWIDGYGWNWSSGGGGGGREFSGDRGGGGGGGGSNTKEPEVDRSYFQPGLSKSVLEKMDYKCQTITGGWYDCRRRDKGRGTCFKSECFEGGCTQVKVWYC